LRTKVIVPSREDEKIDISQIKHYLYCIHKYRGAFRCEDYNRLITLNNNRVAEVIFTNIPGSVSEYKYLSDKAREISPSAQLLVREILGNPQNYQNNAL
jgi:hypothetical protein